jgi:oxygen-independent coproporphyrinogen-3 oxidase
MVRLIGETLTKAGYRSIGLDHYALPDDSLTAAARTGGLRRNFQGYTDVTAATFLGVGATAISRLPAGLVQNTGALDQYAVAIRDRRYATARGVATTPDDRLIADVIERLMCDFKINLPRVARRHGMPEHIFDDDLARLQPFAEDELITIEEGQLCITEAGRPAVRLICAAFDHHLPMSSGRHSPAI